jgi:CSLREA domain-containing protein
MNRRTIFCYLIGMGFALATLAFAERPRSAEFPSKPEAETSVTPEQGLGFGVDSTGDGDNAGSSNFCDDGTGHCTLRAAIQAANGHPGVDFIGFVIPASDPGCDAAGNCTINLPRALPDLSEGVSISGPGPSKVIVHRSNTQVSYRIFSVTAAAGTVALSGMTINAGRGPNGDGGGGINNANGATVNISNCVLSQNYTSGVGGAVSNSGSGTVNILGSTLTNNNVLVGGGAVYSAVNGTVSINNSTLSNNASTEDGGGGGGVYNAGLLTITNSTLTENSASNNFNADGGGGIRNSGTANVVNTTITRNSVLRRGGGIYNLSGGTLNLTNSTIVDNSANAGNGAGGVYNDGTMTSKSSLIALNTAFSSPDVHGTFTSQGFNLIGQSDGSMGFSAVTDQTGTITSPLDPKRDPSGLQNNGGPTKTVALLFGSPAIDKGTSAGLTGDLTVDQRGTGFPRTFDDTSIANAAGGDGTDIGAFEVQTGAPTALANISTRLRVETGDNVLIGGFIVTGTQPKKIILRAIGPSLPLAGALADPILELHGPGAFATITNDNWRSDQEAEIIATTIPPTNDLESAIVATLPANNAGYTAIVRGVNNGTGVGLVEAYDLDRAVDSKLGNISTRGLVQTGDNVLIAGTIVLGQAPQRVLVRGIGPSLTGAGVAGVLQNPTLELRDQNGALLRANDNWRSDQESEIIATTIPPTNDLESAIVETLPAGGAAYTAVLRGVTNTTGIAVVEVYALN